MAPVINMKRISKSFFGVKVLDAVDFNLERGEIQALCGENGAGKSTLMKILAAVYTNEEGEILIEGQPVPKNANPKTMQQMGVSYIHQELNLVEHMTVAQNIFLSREPISQLGLIDYPKMNRDAAALLEELGENISPTAKVASLKIAQKQMVEIAKAISMELKVLIMDEPTSVLSLKETEILFNLIRALKKRNIGIVYISHRLREIKEIADTVTVLRDGKFIVTKQVSEVSEKDIASLMVGREVSESIADDFSGNRDDVVLEVHNISAGILQNISFKISRGEILGFSGLVGAGRSELMELIFGLYKTKIGSIKLEGKPITPKSAKDAIILGMGFATEDRKSTGLVPDRDIGENGDYVYKIKTRAFLSYPKRVFRRSEQMINRLNIRCLGPGQLVKNLSGGNQQKVVLSKWLSVNPGILIADEPTRGIDVGARQEIYTILRELANEGKAIIIVSSDITEILSICHRVLVMHDGVIRGELSGKNRTEQNIMNYAANVAV
jgi:ABC-type sugar transport system ATPase subunit